MENAESPSKDGKVEKLTEATTDLNEQASGLAKALAQWLEETVSTPGWLIGPLTSFILLVGLLLIGWLLVFIVRPLVLRLVKAATVRTKSDWDDKIRGFGLFRWSSHLAPAILIVLVAPGLLAGTPGLARAVVAFGYLYMITAVYMTFDSLVNFSHHVFKTTQVAQRVPTDGVVQVIKLIGILAALILGVSVLVGRSPLVLLGGLGVFASVLMLIFKDVILGFVAGIQIAANKMVSAGDWMEMPSEGVDGDVIEVGLTTVKVQNWDKTISTIPTYSLIAKSFKNWRGMTEAGGRRIKRSILIDTDSIRFIDRQLLERLKRVQFVADYLEGRENEIAKANQEAKVDDSVPINGRRQTNVGAFRAYAVQYLSNHPEIHQDMTLLVRQLKPEGRGLPIELYCFTNDTRWARYEDIQSDIFDHLYAAAREFDLKVFQEPTGANFRDAFAGKDADEKR